MNEIGCVVRSHFTSPPAAVYFLLFLKAEEASNQPAQGANVSLLS